MSIIRLRCNCKKIIVNNETHYTFVFNNYNQSDMKKLLDNEQYVFLSYVQNIQDPNMVIKMKSFVNDQELESSDISNNEFTLRQVFLISSHLNDIKIKSNIKIQQLVENVNKSKSYELFLYVKLHKSIKFSVFNSVLEICGVEIPKNKQELTENTNIDKIINMIKKSKANVCEFD